MKRTRRFLAMLLVLALLLCACAAREEQREEREARPAAESAPEEGEGPAPAGEAPKPTEEELPPAEDDGSGFTLWIAEDAPLSGDMAALCEQYLRQAPDCGLVLRRFATSEELDAALETGKPDLLLCGGVRAAALIAAGRGGVPVLSEETQRRMTLLFREAPGCAEGLYCPLGAALPVLTLREENLPLLSGCGSMESLCAAAGLSGQENGAPFLSADSFSQLFSGMLAQKGRVFYAMREQDLENQEYRAVYNLLAGAAYDGGLVSADEAVLPMVARGDLICGVCSSRELFRREAQGLIVLPLPPMEGCEALTETEFWGLLSMSGRDRPDAVRFVAWLLQEGRAAEAALAVGLLPAEEGDWSTELDAAAAGLLCVVRTTRPWVPEEDGAYLRSGADFEQSFRAALALLG